MNEQVTTASADITRELEGMELYVRALEDAAKRLESTSNLAFTLAHQEQYTKLQERLFDLTK